MDLSIGKYKMSFLKNSTLENPNLRASGNSRALITGGNMFGNINLLTNYKFADVILFQLITKIVDAMSGIVWTFDGSNKKLFQVRLKMIFEKRFGEIYKYLYFNGICVFVASFEKQDVKLLTDKQYRVENDGSVTIDNDFDGYIPFIIYSDTYKMFGKTDYMTCQDMYKHIDNLMNAINATTENLGAMGILSPESTAGVMTKFSDTERELVQKDWRERYGLKVGKWSIMITQTPTKFQQINLPIKDLELQAKLENAVKILAGYHKVPYELIALSGQSTYANRKEAMNELIDITCKSYANKLFDLSKEIFFAKGITVNYTFEKLT